MKPNARPLRTRSGALALAGVIAAAGTVFVATQVTAAPATTTASVMTASEAAGGSKPTIVLVHGAWADASSRNGVTSRLQHAGYTVYAPPNPLRGVSQDAETLSDFLATIPGPMVLVGHSYGGFVITNAAVNAPNVKALVYDNAYIPDQGETVFQINAAEPGSCVTAEPSTFLNLVPYPGAADGDVDAYLKFAPSGDYRGFQDCFANGVSNEQARLLAAGQRPFAVSAGSQPSGAPAWKSIPSWAVVGTQDHVIPPAELRFMAERAHARITEVKAGHLSLVTRPDVVADTITAAARTAG
ncbi:alpha/beta fold hydrolase [Streptomyces sp. A012304]|uniref:alpha/beta fold hydrolase n=1 Tax=Streptomyces sp. A012304 TaxID=375446 RepID=UPI00222ECE75|nr:alpha/beta hydrolase [Streptomyces sp. A012304]GKQ34104.1 alpha/beta hydrolase [Streptomyces sp. A012304]